MKGLPIQMMTMDLDNYTPARIERTTIADHANGVPGVPPPRNNEHFLVGPRAVSSSSTSTTFREMGFGPDSELVKIITPLKEGKVQPWILRIGRNIVNIGLRIDAPIISGLHAILYGDAGSTYILDPGSTNGTYVNGLKIEVQTPRQLLLSATIRFGPEKIPSPLDGGQSLANFPWASHDSAAFKLQLPKYSGSGNKTG